MNIIKQNEKVFQNMRHIDNAGLTVQLKMTSNPRNSRQNLYLSTRLAKQ